MAGSTGPLFTLLLSLFYFLFHDVIWSAKLIGVVCQIGSAFAIYLAARHLDPKSAWAPLLAGLLVAVSPPLLWASLTGMEIGLYLLLVCAGIYFHTAGRNLAATLCWAIGVWVRPDGLFLLALSLALIPGGRLKRTVGAATIVLGFLGFNLATGGTPLPQTVGVKAHLSFEPVTRTWNMLREWGTLWGAPYRPIDDLEHPIALLFLLVIGAVATFTKRPLLALYAIGFPIALSLFRDHSGSHKRYLLHVVPFGLLLAVQGLAYLSDCALKRGGARGLLVAGAALLLWQGTYAWRTAETYGWNVQNINQMQCVLGDFARRVTRPGQRVATNDIGAIGFYSHRYVVDLMGLVTPLRPLPEQLSRYEPELMIVFADWFEKYLRTDPVHRTLVFYDADSTHKYMLVGAIELRKNTICAKDQMLALKRVDRDAAPPPVALMERY